MPIGYGPGDWDMSIPEAIAMWTLVVMFALGLSVIAIESECGKPAKVCVQNWFVEVRNAISHH